MQTPQQLQQEAQRELFEFQKKTAYAGTVPDNIKELAAKAFGGTSPMSLKINIVDWEAAALVSNTSLFNIGIIIRVLASRTPDDMKMNPIDYVSYQRSIDGLAKQWQQQIEPEHLRLERKINTMARIQTPGGGKLVPIGKAEA